MLNRTSIMQAAWADYRRIYEGETFDRRRFGNCLAAAWQAAKREAKARSHIRAIDAMTAAQRIADPAAASRQERIEALEFLPFRYRIAPMVEAIRAEHAAA